MTAAPLRVAVVGAGYFARFHHDAWHRLGGAELVGIADLDADKAAEAARAFGARAFTDVEAMLDATAPDLLDIATPPATHLALVAAAGERGLPAICQKPLAPTLEEARRVVETAEAADSLLVVHENFRFQPWYREARRLIDQGRFGPLHDIAFRLRPGDGQGPDAYLARQPYFQRMPRFLVHETGVHFVDTFRYLMGEVEAVFAELRRGNPVIAGEDAGYVLFRFRNGATGLFDANRLNDHVAENPRLTMGEMWLEGEMGVLRLNGDGRLFWKPHRAAEAAHDYAWDNTGFGGDSVSALQAHVVAHFRAGGSLVNSGWDYLRNVEIVEAIYRSNDEGRWIEV